MTTVFFLFLTHASLGLLALLLFVPDVAGRGFFKFCSGTVAVMTTWALGLLLRRYGLGGGAEAPGGERYALLIASTGALLTLALLHNRAWHFDWQRLRRPLLWLGAGAGVLVVFATAPPGGRVLVTASGLSSALLLGAGAAAMILGHWYLVVLDLPISALRRLTVVLVVGLALRALIVGLALFGPFQSGLTAAGQVAVGLWSLDGVFVWMRLLFGLVAPLSLIGFIWKTVEIRSTQSATGILYVELFLVMAGELLACYLRVVAGVAL